MTTTTTATDTLRRAARLMRERAQAATQTSWDLNAWQDDNGLVMEYTIDTFSEEIEDAVEIARCGPLQAADAEHIAAFASPPVALAVAAWLDAEASIQALYPDRDDDDIANALAVARAYLGE